MLRKETPFAYFAAFLFLLHSLTTLFSFLDFIFSKEFQSPWRCPPVDFYASAFVNFSRFPGYFAAYEIPFYVFSFFPTC